MQASAMRDTLSGMGSFHKVSGEKTVAGRVAGMTGWWVYGQPRAEVCIDATGYQGPVPELIPGLKLEENKACHDVSNEPHSPTLSQTS